MNIKRFISAILCVISALSFLFMFGCADDNTDVTTTKADDSAVTEAKSEGVTEYVTSAELTSKADETTTQADKEKAPETVEEIVAYFNESANRIKTEASRVTKNYEKRIVDEENLVIPKVLESTAKKLLPTVMKDDTDPIIYDSREEIVSEYIVPEQNYVSKLTADAVAEATCSDNGYKYEIRIKLKPEKNPSAGKGVGAVCDVIEAHEVEEKAPSFIEEFSTSYKDCVVVATVDKATGRVVHSSYTTPLILTVRINLFGMHVINIGLTFVKDYTVEY